MKESSKGRGTERVVSYVLGGSVCLLLLMSVVGGILTVGDHLSALAKPLGVAFYVLLAVVAVLGVGYPLFQISRRPVFALYRLNEGPESRRAHYRNLLAQNVCDIEELDESQKEGMRARLAAGDSRGVALEFASLCGPLVDRETKQAAKRAFFASAVAHSALVETVTMVSISLDLVRRIVEVCGFRPTRAGLAKLYARVMASALIAGGVEDMGLDDMFGEALGGSVGAKASGLLLGSAADGLVGAFLVFRIGAITKDYLFALDAPAQKDEVRRASFRQAMDLMKASGFIAEMAKSATSAVTDRVQGGFSNLFSSVKKVTSGYRYPQE